MSVQTLAVLRWRDYSGRRRELATYDAHQAARRARWLRANAMAVDGPVPTVPRPETARAGIRRVAGAR